LPSVSRIERQRYGPFAALPIRGAVSLGMLVSLEEGIWWEGRQFCPQQLDQAIDKLLSQLTQIANDTTPKRKASQGAGWCRQVDLGQRRTKHTDCPETIQSLSLRPHLGNANREP
jgi:hypothetical protein